MHTIDRDTGNQSWRRSALSRAYTAELRRRSFRKVLDCDRDLLAIARRSPTHHFLANPASQNTFLYQIEFVQALSEFHFQRSLSEISILDWGCGKGHVSFLLKRRGAQVTSCDYCASEGPDNDSAFGQDTPLIRAAGIHVDRLCDPIRLPYSDHPFDVALSFGVLEHVANDFESLKELRRVLRAGGLFFCFNLPYFLSWTQRVTRFLGDSYHDRFYDQRRVQNLVQSSGFELLDFWHRQLLPKNRIRYPRYDLFEALDQFLVSYTPLKYLATNLEFVSFVPEFPRAQPQSRMHPLTSAVNVDRRLRAECSQNRCEPTLKSFEPTRKALVHPICA